MIEGGKRLPHWSMVMRILHALDTTLCEFLTAMEGVEGPEGGVLSHRSDRLVLCGPEPNERGELPAGAAESYTHVLTTWSRDLQSEVLEVFLPPHSEWTADPVSFNGLVIAVGISGRVLLVIDGTEYVMRAGETLRYDGSHPHSLRNYTDDPTLLHMIVTPPAI